MLMVDAKFVEPGVGLRVLRLGNKRTTRLLPTKKTNTLAAVTSEIS